jgi:uncharacterized Zn-binding protein involved in type VI secretion
MGLGKNLILCLVLLSVFLLSCGHAHPGGVTKQDRAEAANDPKICLKASVPDVCLTGVAVVNCNAEACKMISDSQSRKICLGRMETCVPTGKEEPDEEKEYGVIEKDGKLYLNAKPGETLNIKTEDLPMWARGQIATLGAQIAVVGPPDMIVEGDSTVLLDGKPIARLGDSTAHGGEIVEGSDRIFVNGQPVAFIGAYAVDPMVTGTVPNVGGQIVNN